MRVTVCGFVYWEMISHLRAAITSLYVGDCLLLLITGA